MVFEENLARTLADGPLRTEVDGGRLTLTTDAGDTVRLTRQQAAPLYGTRWTVTALGEGGPEGVAEPLPQGAAGPRTSPSTGPRAPSPAASPATR
ncbi:hypothetical protein GCM10020295_43840 [Streptomyces cinereospinus]